MRYNFFNTDLKDMAPYPLKIDSEYGEIVERTLLEVTNVKSAITPSTSIFRMWLHDIHNLHYK